MKLNTILPTVFCALSPIFLLLIITPQVLALPVLSVPSERSFYLLDGDSLSLQMRIYGIDTPEKKQTCQQIKGVENKCGELAKQTLRYLLDNSNGAIEIKPIAFDKFGRMLVKLYRNGTDIGQSMVRAGIAFAYGSVYKEDEALAKKEKLGFWAYHQMPERPALWRKNNPRK